ncbi:hypothetical protein H4R35_001447 [Dimargaris xerosporica]|nr:hypothetical protein H4R35_001447 [Dimargaris xerosporica]
MTTAGIGATARLVWLLLALLLCLASTSHAWLYVTSSNTSETTKYQSIDYEGDISNSYDITGVLVSIPVDSQCRIRAPANSWDPINLQQPLGNGTDARDVNSTVLLLTRWPTDGPECVNYAGMMHDIPRIIEKVEMDRNYPPVRVLVFTATGDSSTNFGSANDEFYTSYWDDKPSNVSVAYIGSDVGKRLHAQAMDDQDPLLVQAVHDKGIWNAFRESAGETALVVLRFIFIVPVLTFAIYYIIKLVYNSRTLRDRRVPILVSTAIFLIGALVVPMGYMQQPHEVFIRYICWLFGYGAYTWVLLSWANIICKTQKPRFWWIFTCLVHLGMLMMVTHSITNCIYSLYITPATITAKSVVGTIVLPPVLILKAIFMGIYGTSFLWYIRHQVGYENLRNAFRKLTYLTYSTFVAFIVFAVCTTMTNSYFNSMVWVIPFRSVGCNFVSAFLSAVTIVILRVHEDQPLAANPQTLPSTTGSTTLQVSTDMAHKRASLAKEKTFAKATFSPTVVITAAADTNSHSQGKQSVRRDSQTPMFRSSSYSDGDGGAYSPGSVSSFPSSPTAAPTATAAQHSGAPTSLRPYTQAPGRFTLTRPANAWGA